MNEIPEALVDLQNAFTPPHGMNLDDVPGLTFGNFGAAMDEDEVVVPKELSVEAIPYEPTSFTFGSFAPTAEECTSAGNKVISL
jgi:hypothetical protein